MGGVGGPLTLKFEHNHPTAGNCASSSSSNGVISSALYCEGDKRAQSMLCGVGNFGCQLNAKYLANGQHITSNGSCTTVQGVVKDAAVRRYATQVHAPQRLSKSHACN